MRPSPLLALVLVLVCVGCGACGSGRTAGRGEAPTGPAADDSGDDPLGDGPALGQAVLAAHGRMHARFAASADLHRALSVADLATAHRDAATIASLDEPEALPTWRPYIDDVRAAAREVEAAADPVSAAHAMGRLGRGCARCHRALQVTAKVAPDPRPDEPAGPATTMAGHHWAAAQLWEGLIAPSTVRWIEGARALEGAPIAITAEADAPGHRLGIADDVAQIRALARRAATTDDLDARATLFGDLLGRCVRCHATIRDR